MARSIVSDVVIDPARMQKLVNPEFRPNGLVGVIAGIGGEVGHRYDALPAAAAAEPTAFGCVVVEDEVDRRVALIALVWDGGSSRFHRLSPVDVRTTTVAERPGVATLPAGRAAA